MYIESTLLISFVAIGTLIGFGLGILAGYHVLKSDWSDMHDWLEYLIHRQNPIPNSDSKIEIDVDNVYHVFKEVK